jgi:hypothetical protein
MLRLPWDPSRDESFLEDEGGPLAGAAPVSGGRIQLYGVVIAVDAFLSERGGRADWAVCGSLGPAGAGGGWDPSDTHVDRPRGVP